MKTRVLIVDDSTVGRELLRHELSQDPAIEVVGFASSPYRARDEIARLSPDVITLNIEMPCMDGLAFLRKLMRFHPIPVVAVSFTGERRHDRAIQALADGAVEVMMPHSLEDWSCRETWRCLTDTIKAVDRANVSGLSRDTTRCAPMIRGPAMKDTTTRIVAIGASTGGTQALQCVLSAIPENGPPFVIVQHMPEHFTKVFAERLNRFCAIRVKEAVDGDAVLPGTALIAPGNYHMLVRRTGRSYLAEIRGGPSVNRQRPSVDVLFESVAHAARENAIGVVLTGMGRDGAVGLLALKRAGADTIAEDERSCIVFGMPRAAIAIGAADQVIPLGRMAESIVRLATHGRQGVRKRSA